MAFVQSEREEQGKTSVDAAAASQSVGRPAGEPADERRVRRTDEPDWLVRIGIVPENDPVQATRMRRFLLSIGTWVLGLFLWLVCGALGFLAPGAMAAPIVYGLLVYPPLYLVFRSGFNKRFSDPGLLFVQMLAPLMLGVLLAYYAGPVRPAVMMFFMIPMMFGIFRLDRSQFMQLAMIAITSYGIMLWLLFSRSPPGALDLNLELFFWLTLAAVYPWFAIIGGYMGSVRRRMRKTNEELQLALSTIQTLAETDELTSIANRRRILDQLRQCAAQANSAGCELCVALIDLDYFKRINDSFGHAAGDAALRAFAAGCTAMLRTTDRLGRYGGEEFLLIMSDTSAEEALQCVARIRRSIRALVIAEHPSLVLTFSAGIAQCQNGEDVMKALARADTALYAAKAQGRNREIVATPEGPPADAPPRGNPHWDEVL